MSSLPRERLGVGSSFLTIVRSIGNSIGAALGTTIVSFHLIKVTVPTSLEKLKAVITSADSPALDAFLKGFTTTCWCGVGLCIAGALISLVRVSDDSEKLQKPG